MNTTLIGEGCAQLGFKNCHTNSFVKVFLDSNEISSASANEEKTVDFQFTNGQELVIKEVGVTIAQFNHFFEYDCTGSCQSVTVT